MLMPDHQQPSHMIILITSQHSNGLGSRTCKCSCDTWVQMNKYAHEEIGSKEANACSVPVNNEGKEEETKEF